MRNDASSEQESVVHSQYKANDDYFVHNLFTHSNTLVRSMIDLQKRKKCGINSNRNFVMRKENTMKPYAERTREELESLKLQLKSEYRDYQSKGDRKSVV